MMAKEDDDRIISIVKKNYFTASNLVKKSLQSKDAFMNGSTEHLQELCSTPRRSDQTLPKNI